MKSLIKLVFVLAAIPFSASAADGAGGFATKAPRAYMIESTTNTVILAKNENQIFAPASLSKLMTADLVFDSVKSGALSLDQEYPVSEFAWRTGGAPSRTATMFAALKSKIRVDDLIKGVVIQGANDACIALSEGMSGTEAAFAAAMTRRAKALDMTQSVFGNSTGLPDNGRSKTTAKDMVKLAADLQQSYPDFYRYYALPDFTWNKISQRNRNPLLGLDAGVDGLVTGFAEGEGYSIVASASRNDRRVILVLSGLASDKERTEEAKRVLDWGLTNFETRQVFAAGEQVAEASVFGGQAGSVPLATKDAVSVYLPSANPDRLSAQVVYHWPLKAPVTKDTRAATLRIFAGGKALREVPLFTGSAVEVGSLTDRAWDAVVELTESLLFSWLWDKPSST